MKEKTQRKHLEEEEYTLGYHMKELATRFFPWDARVECKIQSQKSEHRKS